MAKKKILTEDKIMQQAKERELSMLKDPLYHCGEPTYRFRIGDKVLYGAFAESVVTDVIEGGKAYFLDCKNKKDAMPSCAVLSGRKCDPQMLMLDTTSLKRIRCILTS